MRRRGLDLHPLSVYQALNLVTRVSYPSYASTTSDASADLDGMDAMDDLGVATDVATGPMRCRCCATLLRRLAIRASFSAPSARAASWRPCRRPLRRQASARLQELVGRL